MCKYAFDSWEHEQIIKSSRAAVRNWGTLAESAVLRRRGLVWSFARQYPRITRVSQAYGQNICIPNLNGLREIVQTFHLESSLPVMLASHGVPFPMLPGCSCPPPENHSQPDIGRARILVIKSISLWFCHPPLKKCVHNWKCTGEVCAIYPYRKEEARAWARYSFVESMLWLKCYDQLRITWLLLSVHRRLFKCMRASPSYCFRKMGDMKSCNIQREQAEISIDRITRSGEDSTQTTFIHSKSRDSSSRWIHMAMHSLERHLPRWWYIRMDPGPHLSGEHVP